MSSCASYTNVDAWMSNHCTEYALEQTQDFYSSLFNNFYQSTEGIWLPGVSPPNIYLDETLAFQNLLVDLCNTDGVGKYCREPLLNVCSKYTRADTSHPIIRSVCGCWLPDSEYLDKTRACDNICSAYNTIKYHEPDQSTAQTCDSSVCVIDNITLIAKGSSIGDITFTQACSYCGVSSDCRCIIGDINLIIQDSRMGELNLDQNCGGSIECYTTIEGVRTEVPDCTQYINSFGLTSSVVDSKREFYQSYSITFLVFSIILVLLFVVVGLYMLFRKEKAEVVQITVPEAKSAPKESLSGKI